MRTDQGIVDVRPRKARDPVDLQLLSLVAEYAAAPSQKARLTQWKYVSGRQAVSTDAVRLRAVFVNSVDTAGQRDGGFSAVGFIAEVTKTLTAGENDGVVFLCRGWLSGMQTISSIALGPHDDW